MTEDEYNMFGELFATAGWKRFVSDMEKTREQVLMQAPEAAVSGDMWQFVRGQTEQIRIIVGFESWIEAAWKQQNSDDLPEDFPEIDENDDAL